MRIINKLNFKQPTAAPKLIREPARPGRIRDHKHAAWMAVGAVCFGAFMGQLDASIVTLAFPSIQREFHTSLANVQWVSLAYLLALIILLIPIGRLSDRYGRKLVYLYGFVIFSGASALCATATSLAALISWRVAQAVGASMLQANSIALVSTSTTGQRRRSALGFQAAAQSLGLALGPVVGGILVSAVGWRWIFDINVPVGIVAVVTGWFLLPRTKERSRSKGNDVVGLILLAIAAVSGLVSLSGFSGTHIPTPELVGLMVASALAIIGFVQWERRARRPLVDFTLLSSRRILPMLLGALLSYLVLFGPLVLFPQVWAARGITSYVSGMLLFALPAGFGLAAIFAERLLPKNWPDRIRCLAGGSAATLGGGILVVGGSLAVQVAALALMGIGLGIFIPANNHEIMKSVPHNQSAVVGGMINISRGLGTALGVAVIALTLHFMAHVSLASESAPMAVLVIAGLAATWIGWRDNQRTPVM